MRVLASGRAGMSLRGFAGSPSLPRVLRRRPRPRTIMAGVIALLVLAGIWLWVRDSPLVSVQRVTVTGAAGPDAAAIRSALTTAAQGMTTLDVNQAQLTAALAPYPEVKSLQVSSELPHGLRIRVIEQLPVAQVEFGGRSEAVTADGILLDSQRARDLPQIVLSVPPGGNRLTEAPALAALRALSAAPYQLLNRIDRVKTDPAHGVVAELRSGPSIYLGDGSDLAAKWLAARAVLSDPTSAGATYIDVTDPARPAAGAGGATVAAGAVGAGGTASQSAGGSSSTTTSTTLSIPGG